MNPYVTELSENRGSDGSGIRFGKCPQKRFSGYFNVSFFISSIVRFLNHAANKQVYFGTCITSSASGSTLRRLAVIDRVKHLSDTALRS
ncbi:hypothetical protein [Bacteroides ovatus]|uniref:hypothetical protein n=1 Tax=Bacteroides ovatus TaxID=28116 RepID=UPI00397784AA